MVRLNLDKAVPLGSLLPHSSSRSRESERYTAAQARGMRFQTPHRNRAQHAARILAHSSKLAQRARNFLSKLEMASMNRPD